jgi:hypothetical protein
VNAEKLRLAATACASLAGQQRHLVVVFSTVREMSFRHPVPKWKPVPSSLSFSGLGRVRYLLNPFRFSVVQDPWYPRPVVGSFTPRSVAHGMDYPSARRDRSELRNQLLRQRRTLAHSHGISRNDRPLKRALFSLLPRSSFPVSPSSSWRGLHSYAH